MNNMLRQVNQLGQGALNFLEKKPETTLFLGKQDILNLVLVEAIICYSFIEQKIQVILCTSGLDLKNQGTVDISSRYVNHNNSCYIRV